jgi:hypothetical protein
MSAPSEPQRSRVSRSGGAAGDAPASSRQGVAPIDSLPVLADGAALLGVRRVEAIAPRSSASAAIPVVQAAAAAAGGFMAGAAVVGFVHRRQQRAALAKPRRSARVLRRSRRGRRSPARAGELVHIVGSRSLLVDVHLLGER